MFRFVLAYKIKLGILKFRAKKIQLTMKLFSETQKNQDHANETITTAV